jgi:hypothetical protein
LPLDSESESSEELLKTLRDKESWTFAEADQVRELCRADDSMRRTLSVRESEPDFKSLEPVCETYDSLTNEMEAAVKRCGVEEAWHFCNTSRNWLWASGDHKFIRRALGRQNPETTFRELVYPDGSVHSEVLTQLQWLKNYGFDGEMVKRELKAGWKLVRAEYEERKEDQRMFAAAREFLRLEEEARKRAAGWD